MGDEHFNMRAVFIICVIATLAAVYASHEDDVTEATVLISNMKKKGATEADCKDLAKTTCKEVLSEVRKDQKVINSQSSGLECDKLGQRGVTIAIRHYHKRIQQWKVSKKKIVTAKATKVAISSRSYRSLRNGKCEWVFTSTSYKKAFSLYKKAIAHERTVRGWVTEAKRSVAIAKKAQRIQQEKCRCNVIKRRNTFWRTVNNAKKRSRQAKAMKKCKMMQCVLNGTKLSSSKCKGTLPKLVNKKLATKVEKMDRKVCAAHHRENHVKVTGERRSKARARERKSKETSAKEKKNKAVAKERATKRRREQAAKAKAREQKGKHHERRSKAAERSSKERSGKIERANKSRERMGKQDARQISVRRHYWAGYINNWDGTMNWLAGKHSYVSGLQSWHSNHREDRRYRPLVTTMAVSYRTYASMGHSVNSMDGRFDFTCPNGRAIVGMYSWHSNRHEDRQWRFTCASFHRMNFQKGAWPGWQTRWDAHFALSCGHNPAIGFSSYHDNRKEDRRWRIRCGKRYSTLHRM